MVRNTEVLGATATAGSENAGLAGTGITWLMQAHEEAQAARGLAKNAAIGNAAIGGGMVAQIGNAAIAPPGNAAIAQGNAVIGQIANGAQKIGGDMPERPLPRPPITDINQIPLPLRERLGTLIGRLTGDQWSQARDDLRELAQLNPVNGEYAAMQIQQALQQPNSPLRQQVDRWIRDLDNDHWPTRQAAQARLEALGPGAMSYIMARNPATRNHPAFDNYRPPDGQAFNPLESHRRLEHIASAQSEQGRENGVTLNLALRPIVNAAVEAGLRALPEQLRNNPELQQRFRNLVHQVFSGSNGENIGTLLQGLDRQTLQAFRDGLQAAFRSHQSTQGLQVALSGDSFVISTAALGEPGAHMSINTRTGAVRILNTFDTQAGRAMAAPGPIADEPAPPPRSVRDFLTDIRDGIVGRLPAAQAPGYVTRVTFERQHWQELMNNLQNPARPNQAPRPQGPIPAPVPGGGAPAQPPPAGG